MILILIIALVICVLIQTTNWTLESFRFGITVLSFSESFSVRASDKLIGQIVETKGIMFKFVAQDIGLFKSIHLYYRRIGFPLLGELIATKKGTAQFKIRIPFSFIFNIYCLFLV